MFVLGKSVYDTCETATRRADVNLIVACPYKHGSVKDDDLTQWCRACLIARIGVLREQLGDVAYRAKAAAEDSR